MPFKYRQVLTIVATFLVVLTFARTTINGQTDKTFEKVAGCFDNAVGRIQSTDQRNLIRFARREFNELTQKWTSGGSKGLPDDYMKVVDSYCDLLSEVGQQGKSRPQIMKILSFLQNDVTSKLAAANHPSNLASNMNSSITVTVRTMKDNVDSSGYMVRCNPDVYGVTREAQFPFTSVSSPTSRSLPPGTYVFWIEDRSGNVLKEFPGTEVNAVTNQFQLPVN